MASLYELTEEYQILLEMAEDPDTDPEVLADTLEGLDGEIEQKAEGYAMVMKQIEADIKAIKSEEDRLVVRRKSLEDNIARMKQSLQAAMKLTGKTKFKTALFSFGIQKNPTSVQIDEGAAIPEKYLIPQEPKVDKKALLADLKAGQQLDGIRTFQGESLRIR